MTARTLIKPGEYHDSVSLMLVARELSKLEGVRDAAVMMATEANKSILADADLLTVDAEKANPNDLVISVSADNDELAEAALSSAEAFLKRKSTSKDAGVSQPKSIRGALNSQPDANVAVISVAGRYAANEAWQALERGLHVLLFSDNVSIEDEIALKKYARDHGLLLMGPGAGTTILNGVALGFANVLPAGPVGIVSAAGTGLQEVSTLLARRGVGISQGIGTGGRDLKKEIGGIMMLEALKGLQQDPATQVIILISKPPDDSVAQVILQQVKLSSKTTIICFLGGDNAALANLPFILPARTLQECATLAALAVRPDDRGLQNIYEQENTYLRRQAGQIKAKLDKNQRYMRGLFSGGTLCYEAQVIWKEMLSEPVYSNAPLPGRPGLANSTRSQENTSIDLGEEEFTVGRPHPMIDNDLRIRRLLQEARDPQVAVIMLDVVIGYGAHPNPAMELAEAIRQAREQAGHELAFVASVTGTEQDPQKLSAQVSILKDAGVIVCESNAAAARLSGWIVSDRSGRTYDRN